MFHVLSIRSSEQIRNKGFQYRRGNSSSLAEHTQFSTFNTSNFSHNNITEFPSVQNIVKGLYITILR